MLLTTSRVLVDYSTKLPLLLACNTLPFGLGAVLSHRLGNGNERLIAVASRLVSAPDKIIHRFFVRAASVWKFKFLPLDLWPTL